MTEEQFTKRAIESLRKPPYKGIHTVFSNFNSAFKAYFGEGSDPIASTNALAKAGKIEMMFVRGGVMIFLPGEGPSKTRVDDTLSKMGIKK